MQLPELASVAFLLCLSGALVCVCLSAYYTMKVMRSYREDRQWGRFFAPSLLMGSFFTDKGNAARRKMWWALTAFLTFCLGAIGTATVVAP
jgi:hypothetical protein